MIRAIEEGPQAASMLAGGVLGAEIALIIALWLNNIHQGNLYADIALPVMTRLGSIVGGMV